MTAHPHQAGGSPAYPAIELDALRLCGARRTHRRFARGVLALVLATPALLVFVPWQQNLPGTGRVIEYDPVHRPLPLQARTDGVVLRWHVREGQEVHAGDPVVDVADNDPLILERLTAQLDAATQKRDAAVRKREQYVLQVEAAEAARQAAIALADDEVAAAEQALVVAEQSVEVAAQHLELAEFTAAMWTGLVADRIGAQFELQKAQRQRNVAEFELAAKRAAVAGAGANLRVARSERLRVERAELVKVQEARAKVDTADGEVAEADGSIPRLQRDLERQRRQQLTAPVDGYVQHLLANGQGGAFVKAGDHLAMLVPATQQLAVELMVDGNDVTFVDVGRHVRLQFDGWPAVQWVGWPSAAVGTFGGRVAFVDRFDDGNGRFRVMVLPDERPFTAPEGPFVDWLRRLLTFETVARSDNPHAWPRAPWLRQGVRAKGWIVLDRVSLGFELWRRLNGFPPTIAPPTPTGGKGK